MKRKYEITYDDNKVLLDKINAFTLSKEEYSKLQQMKVILSNPKKHYALDEIENIYKMYLMDYSTSEIADVYNKGNRAIQILFKKVGLNRNRFDAQRIAVKKRDYTKIRKTFKKTMKERFVENQLFGSKIEEYARIEFSQILNSILPYESIIGVNTVLKNGELDIPILVLKENKVYKFGVEVDGKVFHKDKYNKDIIKNEKFNKEGYQIYRLSTKSYVNNEKVIYKEDIKQKINLICNQIKEELTLKECA